MMDQIIRDARIWQDGELVSADIAIKGQTIAATAPDLAEPRWGDGADRMGNATASGYGCIASGRGAAVIRSPCAAPE